MELWDLYTESGERTGETMIRGERFPAQRYHLVVHIWIVDSLQRLLIQKRAPDLKLMAGMWAVTGGSAIAGEDSAAAARRELREELGIDTQPGELEFLLRIPRRNSLCDIWLLRRDVEPDSLTLQREEVADVRLVSRGRLLEMVQERQFHNYGKPYFDAVFASVFAEEPLDDPDDIRTLYITDLDGTLLRSDRSLSPYTIRVLNREIQNGTLFSVATARSLMGIRMLPLEEIHFRIPLVLMNGVLLYDMANRRILYSEEMSAETVGRVLDICAAGGKTPFLYRVEQNDMVAVFTGLTSHAEEIFLNERQTQFPDNFRRVAAYDRTLPAVYFSMQDRYEVLDAIRGRLHDLPEVACTLYRDNYMADNWYLEIFSAAAGKDNGMRRLKKMIGAEKTIAFGDNMNDLPMLHAADIACVVANGTAAAREAAAYILASNDGDGVAAFMEKRQDLLK